MVKEIKKYPVFYNNEEYEIRIEQPYNSVNYYYTDTEYVIIYKVTKRKTWFNRTKIIYEEVYKTKKESLMYKYETYDIGEKIRIKDGTVDINSDDYYIQLFKKAFNLYKAVLEKEKEQERKLTALQEWDGIIS